MFPAVYVMGLVASVESELDLALAAADANARRAHLANASENLSALMYKSSYTTRPALNELVLQLRVLSSGSRKAAQVKLLAQAAARVRATDGLLGLQTTHAAIAAAWSKEGCRGCRKVQFDL